MTTPKLGDGPQLSRDELARARRAAAGQPPPAQKVPMGIRYLTTSTATTPPAGGQDRPAWMRTLAATPTEALERLDRDAAGSRPPRRQAHHNPAAAVTAPRPAPLPAPVPARRQTRKQPPAAAVTAEPTTPTAAARVLVSWHAYACRTCGSRYNHLADHECGQLTPVTVTVVSRTSRPGPHRSEVLGSYPAYACEICRYRTGSGDADHPCGPLAPVTVTISVRAGARR